MDVVSFDTMSRPYQQEGRRLVEQLSAQTASLLRRLWEPTHSLFFALKGKERERERERGGFGVDSRRRSCDSAVRVKETWERFRPLITDCRVSQRTLVSIGRFPGRLRVVVGDSSATVPLLEGAQLASEDL